MKAWGWIALGLTGLGLAAAFRPKFARRVLILGDSHSEADWTLGGQIASDLEVQGAERVKRVGNRGKGVRWYIDSMTLSDALAEDQWDTVIVELGGNDAGSRQEAYKAALEEFVGIITTYPSVKRVIWLGPTRSRLNFAAQDKRREIAKWQSEVFDGSPVEWHDMHYLTVDIPTRDDGVHYTAEAYRVWADKLTQGEGPLRRLAGLGTNRGMA